MKAIVRQSNIELARIFAMFFIIYGHLHTSCSPSNEIYSIGLAATFLTFSQKSCSRLTYPYRKILMRCTFLHFIIGIGKDSILTRPSLKAAAKAIINKVSMFSKRFTPRWVSSMLNPADFSARNAFIVIFLKKFHKSN